MRVTCRVTGYVFNAGTLPLDIKGEHPIFGLNAQQLYPFLKEDTFLDLSDEDKNLVVAARLRLSPVVELRHWVRLTGQETLTVFNGLHILEWAEKHHTKVPHFSITQQRNVNVNSYLEILAKCREDASKAHLIRRQEEEALEQEDLLKADDVRAKKILAALGDVPTSEVDNLNKKTAAYVLASVGHEAGSPLTNWYLKLLSTSFDKLVCLDGFRVEDLRYIEADVENWESFSLLKPIALASIRNKIELLAMVGLVAVEDTEDYPKTASKEEQTTPNKGTFTGSLPKTVPTISVQVKVVTAVSPLQKRLQALLKNRKDSA